MGLFFVVWRVIVLGNGKLSRFAGGLRGAAVPARRGVFCGSGGRGRHPIISLERGIDGSVSDGVRHLMVGNGTRNEHNAEGENYQPKKCFFHENHPFYEVLSLIGRSKMKKISPWAEKKKLFLENFINC